MSLTKVLKISALATLIALSNNVLAKDGRIKVGVISGPEYAVAEVAKQVAKEQYGLEVELIPFTDYVTPNAALESKIIDVNAFQHQPYLDKQKADRQWDDLVIVGNTFVYPIAAYSKKIKDISELKDGATVLIPNDPTNGGRALLLLQAQGLITLKDPKGLTQTVLDIVANPKKLKIQTADAPLIPRSLGQVDLAIINNTFAAQAGLYPNKNSLFVESNESPYVNIIVARKDNENDPDVKNFVKAYNSEPVYKKADKEFNGAIVKGWK
ncbi:methionine ABC transporter substrate-binding protein MetQ [Mergibacter septicus]|uniref:Lipoprotein n=1 Tax=Mergibacter septicus TaxID=221402 RepID=A0A8E3MGX0_9PAST|nr:MetQ/NlpA family lipoprotein [Mergibacter septicus]AWX13747.1 methionine ABC transporter substrate-binding protein MetQ [Mergibacter septicus]AWX15747.1 methionine ABC transporter substrate-binding protein MetQ [Mergibacter septicus]QDJ13226.1 methionine ABC transporter substrate-binding protein MetQ [Mergibacter septicus]QDJ15000.1 methionine ABC transporter substrate-binding protein MetQ [Mergibacter septicus]UTU47575.1 MetQ/NlpA family lipoprotein [Mergibacter septicus]